jgi:cytochrome c556
MMLAACGSIDPDSPLGKRKAAFKALLKTSENLGGMMRGRLPFDEAEFSRQAILLDEQAHQPWQHFPDAKDDDRSAARADVWEKQARFKALAGALEERTARLKGYVSAGSPAREALAQQMQQIEQACKDCHQEFRSR